MPEAVFMAGHGGGRKKSDSQTRIFAGEPVFKNQVYGKLLNDRYLKLQPLFHVGEGYEHIDLQVIDCQRRIKRGVHNPLL